MEFDLENPLPSSNDIFDIENDHMPSKSYVDAIISPNSNLLAIRREIVSSIFNISREFDPFLPYLAVNYADRFLSAQPVSEGKPWIFRLVAVSCISLALKMRKQDFSVSDLMDDGGLMFNPVTIERMEMLILGALKWRMRSVNPFSFINYFISFLEFNDTSSIQALKTRATEIILKSQSDIKLLEFKPSTVSASALLVACHEFLPMQFQPFRDNIFTCFRVVKEELQHCYNTMQEGAIEADAETETTGCGATSGDVSSSLTPANVLDFRSSTSGSQGINPMTDEARSEIIMRGTRLQKFEGFTTNNSSQLSQ